MLDRLRSLRAPVCFTLGACAVLVVCGGCYKRVVKAEGIGADGMAVQPSNRSNSLVDKAIFGSDERTNSKRPSGYTPRD